MRHPRLPALLSAALLSTTVLACADPAGPSGDDESGGGKADGSGSGGWQWENPSPDGTIRYATWAISPTDVWTVGAGGLAEHYDGTTWNVVPTGVDVPLTGVWAAASDDVWVVGDKGTVLRYDGSAFTAIPLNTTRALRAIHGTSASDVWIVGDNDSGAWSGLVLHWDGSKLVNKSTSYCPNTLYTVYAKSPTEVWIGGHVKTVCRFDGNSWHEQFINDSGQGAVTSLYVGSASTYALYSGDVYRLDGTSWTRVFTLPRVEGYLIPTLQRLTATSDTNIFASGSHGFVARFDGQTWTPTRIPGNADYVGIALTGASDGWAVGTAARARMAGGQWQETYDVVTRQWLWAASGTSATNLWALGSMGDIIHRTATGWSKVDSPFTATFESFYAVHAIGTDEAWIGGSRAGHFDGQSITLDPALTNVHDFWSASASDVWAVGESGLLAHYDGSAWTKATSPVPNMMFLDVDGTAPDDVWAAGATQVVHYDGATWSPVDIGFAQWEKPTFVLAIAPDDVWVGGYVKYTSVALHHFDGTSWTTIPVPDTTSFISAGHAASPTDVTFVLRREGLVHWDGATLTREAVPGAAAIASAGSTLWVTGEDGMVKRK